MSYTATSNVHKNFYGKKKKRVPVNKKLKRIIRQELDDIEKKEVELKYFDKEIIAGTGITIGGFTTVLSGVLGRGTTQSERVGIQVSAKSFLIRFSLVPEDSTNIVRIMFFRWFEDTVPTTTTVLEPLSTTAIVHPLSPLNINSRNKMTVLYDNLFGMAPIADVIAVDKVYIKKDMNIYWQDDDTLDRGHLYLLAISDSAAGTGPAIHLQSRMRFTDA